MLATAVMLTAFLVAAAIAAAVQETGKCEPDSSTGVYEDSAGASSPTCEEEDPPTPVPCEYDYTCDPCVYPMSAEDNASGAEGSADSGAEWYYPCYPCYDYPVYYAMDATDNSSGTEGGADSSVSLYYPCYPCYDYPVYYDESGSDANGTEMAIACDPCYYPYGYYPCTPCGETTDQAGTSDEAAAGDAPMIVCPAGTEATTGAAAEA